MRLTIYSLQGIKYDGEAKSLNVRTQSGEITILNHHRPLMSLLQKGIAKIGFGEGSKMEVEVESGFLEMDDKNNLSVLID